MPPATPLTATVIPERGGRPTDGRYGERRSPQTVLGVAKEAVPVTGGTAVTVAADPLVPQAIATDATSVYWANEGGNVMKAPLGGGAAITLHKVDGPQWFALAVDTTSVYEVDSNASDLRSMSSLGGAAFKALASGQSQPVGVAVDGTSVYWTNSGDGTVMRLTPK